MPEPGVGTFFIIIIMWMGYSSSGYILGRSARIGILWVVPCDPLEEVMIFCVSWGAPSDPLFVTQRSLGGISRKVLIFFSTYVVLIFRDTN